MSGLYEAFFNDLKTGLENYTKQQNATHVLGKIHQQANFLLFLWKKEKHWKNLLMNVDSLNTHGAFDEQAVPQLDKVICCEINSTYKTVLMILTIAKVKLDLCTLSNFNWGNTCASMILKADLQFRALDALLDYLKKIQKLLQN